MTHSSSSPPAWDRTVWALMAVLCGVLFLDGLDVSMVGMALPSIEADLGLSTSDLQWVVSGYVLGYGGFFLLLGGRAADLLGRRRVLIAALAVFTVASAIGGLVNDGTLLIAARFLKGASAAFTAPAGLSIITTRFAEGPARNRALSIYTATGATGFSFGLIMGGALTELGWRWTFLLPVPLALGLLAAAPRFLPRDVLVPTGRRAFDLAGTLTLTAGMLLLVHTVVEAPGRGWGSSTTVLAFAVTVALLVAFVTIERRSRSPLVRLGILRSGSLVRANIGAMALFGGYIGFQFVMTLYLQTTNGWSAIEAALAFLPAGLLVAFGSPRIGPLVDRFGTNRLVAASALSSAAGYALMLRLDAEPAYAAVILPAVLLIGIGFMLGFPALNMQATNGIADHEQGLASGLVQTSFQIGGALALAIAAAIVSDASGSLIDAYRSAIGVSVGVAALGLVAAATGLAGERRGAVAGAEA